MVCLQPQPPTPQGCSLPFRPPSPQLAPPSTHILMLLLLIQVDCAPANVLLPVRLRAAVGRAFLVPFEVLEDRRPASAQAAHPDAAITEDHWARHCCPHRPPAKSRAGQGGELLQTHHELLLLLPVASQPVGGDLPQGAAELRRGVEHDGPLPLRILILLQAQLAGLQLLHNLHHLEEGVAVGKPRSSWGGAIETQEPKILPGGSKTSHSYCLQQSVMVSMSSLTPTALHLHLHQSHSAPKPSMAPYCPVNQYPKAYMALVTKPCSYLRPPFYLAWHRGPSKLRP